MIRFSKLFRFTFSNSSIVNNQSQQQVIQEQIKKRATTRRLIKKEQIDIKKANNSKIVLAVCTAESYDLNSLGRMINPSFSFLQNRDVLHFKYINDMDLFFFRHGSFVLWKNDKNNDTYSDNNNLILNIRKILGPFERTPFSISKQETEEIPFSIEQVESTKITNNGEMIVLKKDGEFDEEGDDLLSKLALSNGLADSVKVASLENFIDDHIERVREIPPILESGKHLPISRGEVLKLTGQLLHFRAMLNLNSDLLDTPDMYWSAPQLEDLYVKISRIFDNRQRIAILNKKLDYASELADVLGSHLSEQHTWKLEWGIIALITVEVVSDVLHWFLY